MHCHELRIRDQNKNWRIIYRVDGDAIVIVEVYPKTMRETPSAVIEKWRNRLRKYDSDVQGDSKMNKSKRERLQVKGWQVSTVAEFLKLTPEESALVEIKLALGKSLRARREKQMTQMQLAEKIQSSQPRIAKAKGRDCSVSIELLMRAMLATGATSKDIGKVIANVETS